MGGDNRHSRVSRDAAPSPHLDKPRDCCKVRIVPWWQRISRHLRGRRRLSALISVAVISTVAKGNLERKGCTWLTLSSHSLWLSKVRARTESRNLQAETESEAVEDSCLFPMAFSSSFLI